MRQFTVHAVYGIVMHPKWMRDKCHRLQICGKFTELIGKKLHEKLKTVGCDDMRPRSLAKVHRRYEGPIFA